MKNISQVVLSFPSGLGARREFRKQLLCALRVTDLPVVIDLSECRSLNYDDIDILLDCLSLCVGHEPPVILAAGSPSIRVLLEVTRIASLVPVFKSLAEALTYPSVAAVQTIRSHPEQLPRSA